MIKLKDIKRLHFTGIKGVGMTALACIAKDFGMRVTGSDVAEKFVTDTTLRAKGLSVTEGFYEKTIETLRPDLVVYGASHKGEKNIEVMAANKQQIPTLSFGETLGLFFNTKKGISISGVGGKSTTTAIVATILERAKRHPSYLIGAGKVNSLAFPGKYDQAKGWFVSEADEYACSPTNTKPKFYYQSPEIIVIPNLAYDHPDIYDSPQATLRVFKEFVERLPQTGALVANTDSNMVQELLKISKTKAKVITYGEHGGLWRLYDYNADKETISFRLESQKRSRPFVLSVPGKINALNATAAILVSELLGLTDEEIQSGLLEYTGTLRRFEKIFETRSLALYDDYAHHPQEIQATLELAKSRFPDKKILVIFQAHTYSRTKALLAEFGRSFTAADEVIVTDIFASARETKTLAISGQTLAAEIKHSQPAVTFLPSKDAVLDHLKDVDLRHTLILTLGAGDIFLWHPDLIKLLQRKA